MMSKEFANRLKALRKALKLNQEDVARILGVHAQSVSRYERGEQQPSSKKIGVLTNETGINPAWLLTGEGEMFQQGRGAPYVPPVEKIKLVGVEEEITEWDTLSKKTMPPPGGKPEELLFVNVYPLALAANPMNKTHQMLVESVTLPMRFSRSARIGLRAVDDSMAPVITHNAIVGLDFNNPDIESGQVYVVRLAGVGVAVRRVLTENGNVTLKPNNPNFTAIVVSEEDVKTQRLIVGRVKWVLQ